MFPETFVSQTLNALTQPGNLVFDPFSGRGTSILQSLLMGRQASGLDINPVAYCLSAAKGKVPPIPDLLAAIDLLETSYPTQDQDSLRAERFDLPRFFRRAFHHATLDQILYLRKKLDWQSDYVQRFIAAMLIGILHGEMDRSKRYLSNQLPRTICPKPDYSMRYWAKRNLWPLKKNVFDRLRHEATFRLSGEVPTSCGIVRQGDVRFASSILPELASRVDLIITSPPYLDVTNFEEDQWLRLWFLGGEPRPTYGTVSRDDRYTNKSSYWAFLAEAWRGIAPLAGPKAKLVCRLGAKDMTDTELTAGITLSLTSAFPNASLHGEPIKTELRRRQTVSFRPSSVGCAYEIDYTFELNT